VKKYTTNNKLSNIYSCIYFYNIFSFINFSSILLLHCIVNC